MTKPQSTRKSSPASDFTKAANNNGAPLQFGFQLVDDMTVLERKPLPVLAGGAPADDVNSVIINVYDFKNLELMTYVQQVNAGAGSPAPQVFLRPFADLASGYGIAEARDALEALGGNPPPLQQIPGFGPRQAQRPKSTPLPELR